MKKKPIYTISSSDITVRFTAEQVRADQRMRLVNELTDLHNAESLDTIDFLERHALNVGVFQLLPDLYPTIGELSRASDKDLLFIRNMGKVRLKWVREALRKEGY